MVEKCLTGKAYFLSRKHFRTLFRVIFDEFFHSFKCLRTFPTPLKRIFPELHKDATDTQRREPESCTNQEKEMINRSLLHINSSFEWFNNFSKFLLCSDTFQLSIEVNLLDVRTKCLVRNVGTDRQINRGIHF